MSPLSAPTAPHIMLFMNNLYVPLFLFSNLRERFAFSLSLCPQIIQHPYHSRCSLKVCMDELVARASKETRKPMRMALIRTWKESIGMKPRRKMANEARDNTVWYLGSSFVLPSCIFITCGKRNGAATAGNQPGRERNSLWLGDNQTPTRTKVLKNWLATVRHITGAMNKGIRVKGKSGTASPGIQNSSHTWSCLLLQLYCLTVKSCSVQSLSHSL